MQRGEDSGPGWWLLGSLALLPLLPALFSPLLPGLALQGHDLSFTFGPKFEFAGRHFPDLPLWHPQIYCGHPFVPNPQAMALYPPSWLVHALGWSLPLASWWAAGHVLLAAFLFRALALRLGAGKAGASLGALAWALGGQGMGRLFAGHLSWTAALPWVPLLFLGVHGCVMGRTRSGPLQAGLGVGLLALAGAPQAAALAGFGALLWTLFLLGRSWLQGTTRTLGGPLARLGMAGLVALPMLLAQALPTLAFLDRVAEGGRIAGAAAASGAMQPAFLATLLVPLHFGPASHLGGFSWEQAGYVGVPGLLLALVALASRPARETLFPGLLLVVAVLCALGPATPLFALLQELPLLAAFRTPGRWMLLATLALAWLAGLGVPRNQEPRVSPALLWPIAGGLGAAGLVLAVLPGPTGGSLAAWVVLSRFLVPAVLLASALLLRGPRAWSPGAAKGLVLLQAVDLIVLLGPVSLFPPGHPPGDVAGLERGLAALPGGSERAGYRVDHPDLGALGLFPELNRRGIRSTRGHYDPGVDGRYRRWLDALDELRRQGLPVEHALDLMAVRYVFAETPGPETHRSTRLGEGLFLIERPPPPARFRWVGRGTTVNGEEAWWRMHLDPGEHPPDPRQAVTLLAAEEPDPIPAGPLAAEGTLRLVRETPDRIELEGLAAGPGYVVLSELEMDGWVAALDGTAARILRADLLFRAIRVDRAGPFNLSLWYRPAAGSLARGLVLLGLLFALGLLLCQRQGSKRAKPSSPTQDMPAGAI